MTNGNQERFTVFILRHLAFFTNFVAWCYNFSFRVSKLYFTLKHVQHKRAKHAKWLKIRFFHMRYKIKAKKHL